MKTPEAAEEKHINERKKKRDKLRKTIVDEKLQSILFLALGTRGKKLFALKTPRLKTLSIFLTEFWDLLDKAFNKPPYITFEKHAFILKIKQQSIF